MFFWINKQIINCLFDYSYFGLFNIYNSKTYFHIIPHYNVVGVCTEDFIVIYKNDPNSTVSAERLEKKGNTDIHVRRRYLNIIKVHN